MVPDPILRAHSVPHWPALAWAACTRSGSMHVSLYHGAYVECGPSFAVEGVWPGSFDSLLFHRSDLFFGSGVRWENPFWFFATACSTVDRLWHFTSEHRGHVVSNSLPTLMALSDLRLNMEYPHYRRDNERIVAGLGNTPQPFPVMDGLLRAVYFCNLIWDGNEMQEEPKPNPPVEWRTFEDYRGYLLTNATRMGANARSNARTTSLGMLTTVSSGYDSPAASVVARAAGTLEAVTIRQARSLIPRSDDGSKVAEQLGLRCRSYTASRNSFCKERWFLAAHGWSMDLNLSVFDYPTGASILFTGFHGDKVWSPFSVDREDAREVVRGDTSGLGFTEFRLLRGVIHVPVPFMGVRHAQRLNSVSQTDAMRPWRTGGEYDRPIPRRLVEEAGVDGSLFGQRKSASTLDSSVFWPHTKTTEDRYIAFLRQRGIQTPNVVLTKMIAQLEVSGFARMRRVGAPAWFRIPVPKLPSEYLFAWANTSLAEDLKKNMEGRPSSPF